MTGITVLTVTPVARTAMLGIGRYALGHGAFGPVMSAHLMDFFPDGNMGGDLGAVPTGYLGVASLGPAYVGIVADESNYAVAFVGLAVSPLPAAGTRARSPATD